MPKIVPPPSEKKRWKYSTFFITINTNRTDYDAEKLKKALGQILSNDDLFYKLLKGNTDLIDKEYATAQYAVEVGTKTHNVHAHILIKLRHNTKVQFNSALLHKVLEQKLGVVGVYVDVKGFGQSDKTIQEYIFKDQ